MNRSVWTRSLAPCMTAAAATMIAAGRCESRGRLTTECEDKNDIPIPRPKLLFLGTGSSTGCPKQLCTMLFQKFPSNDPEIIQLQAEHLPYCQTSNQAILGDPKTNKNYRNNPSLLISHYQGGATTPRNVVIDVGKTFREASLRWLPEHNIRSLDAVVLTHHHMVSAIIGVE